MNPPDRVRVVVCPKCGPLCLAVGLSSSPRSCGECGSAPFVARYQLAVRRGERVKRRKKS